MFRALIGRSLFAVAQSVRRGSGAKDPLYAVLKGLRPTGRLLVIALAGVFPVAVPAQRDSAAAARATVVARETLLVARHGSRAVKTLLDLHQAQATFRTRHDKFASTLRELMLGAVLAPLNVAILLADSSGWRAIALHDSVPGLVCGIFEGADRQPLPAWAEAGRVACWTRSVQEIRVAIRPIDGEPSFDFETERLRVQRPPAPNSRCSWNMMDELRSRVAGRDSVVVQFVLGADGRPEADGFTILKSRDLLFSATAVELAGKCRYRPGRLNGNPVRVLVRQPLEFRSP